MTRASPPSPAERALARPASTEPLHWPTGRLLSAAARRVEREWNAHLAAWDLNHASLPVLIHLLAGPLSQRELAAANQVTEQTMSRIIARLVRSGYVVRTVAPEDRRRYVVTVTDPGRVACRAAADPAAAEEMVVRNLSAEQVDHLRALLALVAEAERT